MKRFKGCFITAFGFEAQRHSIISLFCAFDFNGFSVRKAFGSIVFALFTGRVVRDIQLGNLFPGRIVHRIGADRSKKGDGRCAARGVRSRGRDVVFNCLLFFPNQRFFSAFVIPTTAPKTTPAIGQIIQDVCQLFPIKLHARNAAVIRHQYAL